jgi:hypothetical protein
VESFRNAEGQPRQRVVVSLGDARLPDGEEATIARAVRGHLLGQSELLAPELSEQAAGWVRRIVQLLFQVTSPSCACRRQAWPKFPPNAPAASGAGFGGGAPINPARFHPLLSSKCHQKSTIGNHRSEAFE